jgi:vacuolar-type H+-ATPase subunit I/STV1
MTQTAIATVIPASPEVLKSLVPASPLVAQAKKLPFNTHDDIANAKSIRVQLKERRAFIMDDEKGPQYTKNINAAHKLHKSLCDSAKVFYIPIDEAVQIIDKGIGAFDQKQLALKEEADRLAREEQEKERQKIMDAAQKKIDNAMKSTGKIETQIEAMQKIADDLLATDEARTLAARQIEVLRLKLENHQDKAEKIQKTAERGMDALPVASPAAVDYSRTKGVKVKKIGKVIDKAALIKAVAEGKLPDVIFDINQGHINRLINMGIVFPADAVKVMEEAKYGGRG